MTSVRERRRAAHDVADHVAAGAEGGHQVVVEGGEQGVEVALANEVVLDALPGGDAQGTGGHRVAQRVHGEVLLCGQDPAGDADPHHADVVTVASGHVTLIASGKPFRPSQHAVTGEPEHCVDAPVDEPLDEQLGRDLLHRRLGVLALAVAPSASAC